jgi:glycylpeptide N-tetradecanoyltransferase
MNQKSKEEGATEPPAPEEQLTDDTNKEASSPASQTSTKSVDKGKSPKAGKSDAKKPATLTPDQFNKLLSLNPALKKEVDSMEPAKVQEMMKTLSLADVLAGASISGKNKKDMASYKFWQTQPVPSFDEAKNIVEDGPMQEVQIDKVPKEPRQMYPGFEWVVMDLSNKDELNEVYDLLSNHYVEDDEAMFRFNYSPSFLTWALKAPGWRKDWHIGVRASQSRKLVAFISAIPVDLRVRKNLLKSSEVNFLCVHKKLRDKRLAPVLIAEITRRCNIIGIFQAIYTAGVLLPTPVSTCRYFHRSLNWEKLFEVGFSPLPSGSTKQRQILKFKLPTTTSIHGLRPMTKKDVPNVLDLLKRYLERFAIAQVFTKEEVEHWLLHDAKTIQEQVVWSYVVEDPSTHKITDFFSFYRLESTALASKKHQLIHAAYLFYYATEAAFSSPHDKGLLKKRLNELVKDAMILAKKENFDVFNALTLLDNPLFLEEQKFGPGDGLLHYYLYNYRAAPIPGGLNAKNQADEKHTGGVGVVML